MDTTDKVTHDDIEAFDARTANEWIQNARTRPVPRKLFGDLWLEGELAILFADTGKGKTVLATQIAESLARGRSIGPFEMEAGKQTVVYLDLEMSDKQFEMRYAPDHDGEGTAYLHNHYVFSDRFKRVQVDLTEAPPAGSGRFETYISKQIDEQLKRTGATVLILDNITCIRNSYYGAREIQPIMRVLRRLRKSGLSILMLAHTPKREGSRPLNINDLQGSKMIGNFADSIFAVGQCRTLNDARYIKHIKARSGSVVFDDTHLPEFILKKIGGNFLGFEFDCYGSEQEFLTDVREEREWKTIDRIKRLHDEGRTIREIADIIDRPRSTVHRLLQMWRPAPEQAEPVKHYYELDRCIVERCMRCDFCRGRRGHRFKEQPGNVVGHEDCPDTCPICGPRPYAPDDTTVDPMLKSLSDQYYEDLRDWVLAGKTYDRPVYEGLDIEGINAMNRGLDANNRAREPTVDG